MQVVIDIPEEDINAIKIMGLQRTQEEVQKRVDSAIQHGSPLPKGHGRLIDANSKIEVDTAETTLEWIVGETTKKEYTIDYLIEKAGCEVQTIIKADKGGEEGR